MSYLEAQHQKAVIASDRVTMRKRKLVTRNIPVTRSLLCRDSEPYYQLMRQTLLAHEMTKAKEYGATDYQHLHIIPKENKELKEVNTAEGKLDGTNLSETWTRLLKSPEKYKVMDPKDFVSPAKKCRDNLTAITYLQKRYWTNSKK